jgi:hypothetical protein
LKKGLPAEAEEETRALLDARDDAGQTPLRLAVKYGQLEMVKILLPNGASSDAIDLTDTCILESAVIEDDPDIVRVLYPRTRDTRGRVSVRDWRCFFNISGPCDLEVVDGE